MNSYGIKDFHIINFTEIDSTSTYLKTHFEALPNLTAVFASFQVSGHGRLNRQWMATKCESILFSLLIKDKKIIKNFPKLSLLAAVAVFNLLNRYVEGVSIKWPNDVYINGKKACGILLESKSIDYEINSLVLGIGININTSSFDDSIKDIATSLYRETNQKYDLDVIKKELLQCLLDVLNQILKDDNSYLGIVRQNNYLKDKEVYAYINNEYVDVLVIDINDDNTLLVKHNDKFYNLSVGEVVKK